MSKYNIKQHFKTNEHELVDDFYSKASDAFHQSRPILLAFVNPREMFIIESIVNSFDELHLLAGPSDSYGYCEMKRVVIAPTFYDLDEQMLNIELMRIHFPYKFTTIMHRDVLGTLMSLGISRFNIGDIRVAEQFIDVFIQSEMKAFFKVELTQIKNSPVELEFISISEVIESDESYDEVVELLSSLRLDVVVKQLKHISRDKAQRFIKAGKVKVNHVVVQDQTIEIDQNDLISISGFGRAVVSQFGTLTKKDKIPTTFKVLKSK
ncbi:RNA-binding protein [Abyssicoccus albus]|uniref:RNA-binding protein YlmH n=1 Tax=Abyssicoccus albus TaxID=1817405 RepID=A0A3N5C655_9BACL|nr:YlmH/Sll1252 family protein [Abyssicoccus albus]RPF57798.1 RNA-binding protein YlmH [Abyssicoccus albus]